MPDPKLLWFHSTERKSVYVRSPPEADVCLIAPLHLPADTQGRRALMGNEFVGRNFGC